MLQEIGLVKAVLNRELILIQARHALRDRETLVVFARIDVGESHPDLGLKHINIPKGTVVVVLEQEANMYLASPFTKRERRGRVIVRDKPPLFDISPSLRAALEREQVQLVDEETETGPSASIDTSESLGILVSKDIKVGDLVARSRT